MRKRRLRRSGLLILVLALAGGPLLVNLVRQPGATFAADTPERREPPIRVPPGFVVERVAGPPLVEHPMMACFDDRGRLFVAEAAGQNLKADQLLKDPPNLIRLLEDTDGDGRFDKSTVFADKMTFPMGVLWHDGAVYSASPPSVWRLDDRDGDGVADARRELVTRFGFTGNAADIHGPFLGPDGRFYWTDGRHGHEILGPDGRVMKGKAARIFRCRPDGRDVEVVCGGGMDDPVEIVFTPEGEALATVDILISKPKRIDAVIHCVEGGVFPHYEPVLSEFKRTGDLLGAVADLGWVAPAGLLRYRGTALGQDYAGNLFTAQFNTHKVQRHVLTRAGATFRAGNEDFFVASDPDSHPTDVLEDADGSLLVIDTGGWFRIGCPTSQIAKPEIKGAIYRVRRADAVPVADPRGLKLAWDRLTPAELARLLDDPRVPVRDRAIHQMAKLGNEAVAALKDVVGGGAPVRARRNALWAAVRLDTPEASAVVRSALADTDPSIRLVAAHGVGLRRDAEALTSLTTRVVKDESPAVRRAAATALGRLHLPVAVPALLAGLRAGGDRFLEHALIYALIEIADRPATLAGLRDPTPAVRRAALIALDQMDGGNLTRELVVPLLDTDDPALRQTVWSLITARPDWADEVTGVVRGWLSRADLPEGRRDMLRTALVAFARNPSVQELVRQALRREETPLTTRLLVLEAVAQVPLDQLPPAWVDALIGSLGHGNERVARQAVATIRARGTKDFDGALQRLAGDVKRPAELRVAALGAVTPGVASPDAPLFQLVISRLGPDQPPLARLEAATALGSARLTDAQLEALARTIGAAGPSEMSQLLAAYERSTSPAVGKALVAALSTSPAAQGLAPAGVRRALQSYPAEVRQAAEPLLKRLEVDTAQQQSRLTELEAELSKGDVKRGRQVFFGNKAACSTCHAVQAEGGRVGPDLSKIGAIRTGRDLLEAVVFPSASFVRGYEPYVVTTRDGRLHTGVLARETADALHLVTADRTEVPIPRAAVETIEQGRASIMPQGLDAQLSRQELADLIAFLRGLK